MYAKMFSLGKVLGLMALVFWLVIGVAWLFRRQEKKTKVQATWFFWLDYSWAWRQDKNYGEEEEGETQSKVNKQVKEAWSRP